MPRFIKPGEFTPGSGDMADTHLRPLGDPAPIIPFPGAVENDATSERAARIPARVQVRTRRLSDHRRPAEDRYEASFETADSSPVELLKSLTLLLEEVNELKRSASISEPVIVDIHLIAG